MAPKSFHNQAWSKEFCFPSVQVLELKLLAALIPESITETSTFWWILMLGFQTRLIRKKAQFQLFSVIHFYAQRRFFAGNFIWKSKQDGMQAAARNSPSLYENTSLYQPLWSSLVVKRVSVGLSSFASLDYSLILFRVLFTLHYFVLLQTFIIPGIYKANCAGEKESPKSENEFSFGRYACLNHYTLGS